MGPVASILGKIGRIASAVRYEIAQAPIPCEWMWQDLCLLTALWSDPA